MPFRSKCQNCGRRQSVSDDDAGKSVWCNACGGKFLPIPDEAVQSPAESGDSIIPVIDFPLVTVAPAEMVTAPPTPERQSTLQTSSAIVSQSLSDQLPQRPYVGPPPIVPPPLPSALIPMGIALMLAVGLLIAVGVFLLGAWFGSIRHSTQTASLPPKPPVSVEDRAAVHSSGVLPVPMNTLANSSATDHRNFIDEKPKVVPTPLSEVVPRADPILAVKFQPVHPASDGIVPMDEQIGQSIDRGVNYLLSQFIGGKLKQLGERNNSGMLAGMDALAVYALLQAGEATHDSRLGAHAPLVGQMLDSLKEFAMDHDDATYSRSLRSAALSVYHRAEDKSALRADAAWLIAASNEGAFTYQALPHVPAQMPFQIMTPGQSRLPSRVRPRAAGGWDNSNSQYGALGVWAALEAGVEVPNSFWMQVQKHWLGCQLPDGEWAYTGYGEMGRLSMTVAGITTLFVTEDQLDARTVVSTLGHPPFSPALLHGLNWLESGDNSVRLPPEWRTYNLFGLERAALACGFKYFGTHDWYRELAKEQLALQTPAGAWQNYQPVVDTSYTLLFLSRGRHPIFMNKLRFETYWANRPRDIANLTHYAANVLERPINWQVVSFQSDWADWMDSPVLYIASHEALNFSEKDCAKLRAYAENGGLIFTHADGDSPAFNKSVAELSHKLFPEYPLTDLAPTHPIFNTLYKVKLLSKLQGATNGSRLLLLHSPADLNKAWQQRDWVQRPASFQMGINIFIYAAGKANLRNKLVTPVVPDPTVTPILTTELARLKYPGNWNPEPEAWPRFTRLFLSETSVRLKVVDVDPALLDVQQMPVAQLSGTIAVRYDTAQLQAIRNYVNSGGILIIDACGGAKAFSDSLFMDVLPHAFPQTFFAEMHDDNPILAGTGSGMTPINLRLRPYRAEADGALTQPIQYMTKGKGMVILSTVDLTTALLGTNTWAVNGYTPETAYDLVRNIVLYALEK